MLLRGRPARLLDPASALGNRNPICVKLDPVVRREPAEESHLLEKPFIFFQPGRRASGLRGGVGLHGSERCGVQHAGKAGKADRVAAVGPGLDKVGGFT